MLPLPLQNLAEGGIQPNPLQVVFFIEALLSELIHFPMMLPAQRLNQLAFVMHLPAISAHADALHLVNVRFLSADCSASVSNTGV